MQKIDVDIILDSNMKLDTSYKSESSVIFDGEYAEIATDYKYWETISDDSERVAVYRKAMVKRGEVGIIGITQTIVGWLVDIGKVGIRADEVKSKEIFDKAIKWWKGDDIHSKGNHREDFELDELG